MLSKLKAMHTKLKLTFSEVFCLFKCVVTPSHCQSGNETSKNARITTYLHTLIATEMLS